MFLFDIVVSSANAFHISRTVIGLYLAQITFWFAGVTRVIGRVIDGKVFPYRGEIFGYRHLTAGNVESTHGKNFTDSISFLVTTR